MIGDKCPRCTGIIKSQLIDEIAEWIALPCSCLYRDKRGFKGEKSKMRSPKGLLLFRWLFDEEIEHMNIKTGKALSIFTRRNCR